MSAIFGILDMSGADVEPQSLNSMRQEMATWGPDRSAIWIDRGIGLGQLLLFNTPEAVREKLPREGSDGSFMLTAEARINNREDLFRELNVDPGERSELTDSQLIERAYLRWGCTCPDHFPGDWSFAIWDRRDQKLFLARDHHGNTSFYYYQDADYFAFASSKAALLALPRVPRRLNELRISQTLVSWSAHGPETEYSGVMRLPPAHAMVVTRDKVDVWRYWYLEETPEVRLKSDDDYVERFLEIYTEAVRFRLRSHFPVAASLSGGLDSGSVCALAARELRAEGQRLAVYSFVPIFDTREVVGPGRFGDESAYISVTSRQAGNIDVNYIEARDVTPLDGVHEMLAAHDAAGHAAVNYFWIAEILQSCTATGSWNSLDRSVWECQRFVDWAKGFTRFLRSTARRLYLPRAETQPPTCYCPRMASPSRSRETSAGCTPQQFSTMACLFGHSS